jgi:hypothetical protein
VLSNDADIARAVAAAGWTFVRFGGRGMTVEGRELDVIHFSATKGGLVAWATLARGESAADPFIDWFEMSPTLVAAVGAAPALKLGVRVSDGSAAVEMLTQLTTDPRPHGLLGYAAALTERGWTVDRERMREDDYDFTWSIPARRGEDALSFGAVFSAASTPETIHINDSGNAVLIEPGVYWSLNIRVVAPARELADALLRQ